MTHRLIDAVELPDHRLSVGMLFVQGAGYRVGTYDGYETRHMSAAAALRLAKSLTDSEQADELKPVTAALEAAADRVLLIGQSVGAA